LEALAKSTLAPTFSNIANTAEGAVAIFKQFGIQANELKGALGSINAVAGKFAVEADDIIAAVKRAGGVFASTSRGVSSGVNALQEFIAVFTSVRATTREGAETIATGLRTIFTRIQRPKTIRFLQEMGVNLLDLQGKFIGPFNAITKISAALKDLDTRDPQFAKLVEQLGGFRQVGKVIPLLAQQQTRIEALAVAKQGLNSIDRDAATAQQSLAVQIAKVREEFIALVRDIAGTSTFQALAKTILELTSNLIKLADTLKPILPMLAVFGVIKGASLATQFGKGIFAKGALKFHEGGSVGRQGFARGGIVPGGRGVRDDVNATLQKGEFVIRRKAVDAVGKENLEAMNQSGRVGLALGGPLSGKRTVGAAILAPLEHKSSVPLEPITKEDVPGLRLSKGSAGRIYTLKREALDSEDSKIVTKKIEQSTQRGIRSGTKALAGIDLSPSASKNIFESANPKGILGSLFEGVLLAVNNNGLFDSTLDPGRPFDFSSGFNKGLGKRYQLLKNISYIDAKSSSKAANIPSMRKKVINQLNLEHGNKKGKKKDTKKKRGKVAGKKPLTPAAVKRKARLYGTPLQKTPPVGLAGGGGVPASLTRGEFVFNKDAAKRLGPEFLHSLNNADRGGFAKGGRVGIGGRIGFANGTGFSGDIDDIFDKEFDTGLEKKHNKKRLKEYQRSAKKRKKRHIRNQNIVNKEIDRMPSPSSTQPVESFGAQKSQGKRSRGGGAKAAYYAQKSAERYDVRQTNMQQQFGMSTHMDTPEQRLGMDRRGSPLAGVRRGGRRLKAGMGRMGGKFSAKIKGMGQASGFNKIDGGMLGMGGMMAGGALSQAGFEKTGAAVTGASAGAMMGGMLGKGGLGVGLVVGGVSSAFNAFIQEGIDRKVDKATKSLTKSLSDLEEGLSTFADTGSFKDAQVAINSFVRTANDQFDAGFAQTDSLGKVLHKGLGALGLGSTTRKLEEGEGSPTKIEFSEFDFEGTRSVTDGMLDLIRPETRIANAQSLINPIELFRSPENFVSSQSGRNISERTRKGAIRRGADLKATTAAGGQAVFEKISRIVAKTDSGVSSEELKATILQGLNKSEKLLLAARVSKSDNQFEALGGSNRDVAARGILMGVDFSVDPIRESQRLAAAVKNAAISLDRFGDNIAITGARIARAGDAGAKFGQANAAILGGGVTSSQRVNPFANSKAFSPEELRRAAFTGIQSLGGSGPSSGEGRGFSGELFGALTSISDLETRLPEVIARAAADTTSGKEGDTAATRLADSIRDEFSDLPPALLNSLVSNISQSTDKNRQGGSLESFARDHASKLAALTTKEVQKVMSDLVKVQNKAIGDYEKAVSAWIGLQEKANSQFVSTIGRDFQNKNRITQLTQNRDLTFEEKVAGQTAQRQARAGIAGAGGVTTSDQMANLSRIDAERARLNARNAEIASDTGAVSTPGEQASINESLNRLEVQENASEGILKDIATSNVAIAAASSDLLKIENKKKSAQQFAEDFISATPAERIKNERAERLAEQMNRGVILRGDDASEGLRGQRIIGMRRGEDSRVTDQRIRRTLAGRVDVDNEFRKGGRTADRALLGGTPLERRSKRTLQDERFNQREAGFQLANRDQERGRTVLSNADQQLAAVTASLVTVLESTLDSILEKKVNAATAATPEKVEHEHGGNVNVTVRVTGAEALNEMGPAMETMMNNRINAELSGGDATRNLEEKPQAQPQPRLSRGRRR